MVNELWKQLDDIKHTGTGAVLNRVILLLAVVILAPACGVKKTVIVPISPKILNARAATMDDVLELLRVRSESVESLASTTMKISLTSGKIESGRLQEYRSAPGYMLVRSPDGIHINIQNPLTKTTILELLSVGDRFAIWHPRENKYFIGRNSIREFDLEGVTDAAAITAKPVHILSAVLAGPPPGGEGVRVAMEEEQDEHAKYYVLSFFREGDGRRIVPIRRIWVERSEMLWVREKWFDESGHVESVVSYANPVVVEGIVLPLTIRIERPVDGYRLDMEFKDWKVNIPFADSAFTLTPPQGAQQIILREKGGN